MYVPQQQRKIMKNAMEMAVMESLRHPNVVRVFATITDMREIAGVQCGSGVLWGRQARSPQTLHLLYMSQKCHQGFCGLLQCQALHMITSCFW